MANLNLRYAPVPANAWLFAVDMLVPAAEHGFTLDFTPPSLGSVDQLIDRLRADGASLEQAGESLFCFGCYLGEVLVRHCGAKWRLAREVMLRNPAVFPLVLELADGSFANPIAKAFKRFVHGDDESLAHFYQVFQAGGATIGPGTG